MKRLIGLLVVITIIVGGLSAKEYMERPLLFLSASSYDVEYGDEFDEDLTEFIDVSNLNKKDSETVLKNTVITFDEVVGEIGKYPVKYEFNNEKSGITETRIMNIVVADTEAPEFNDVMKIRTQKGREVDYSKYIEATDFTGVKSLRFYDEELDVDVIGEYEIIATAKDHYGNTAEKVIIVLVE